MTASKFIGITLRWSDEPPDGLTNTHYDMDRDEFNQMLRDFYIDALTDPDFTIEAWIERRFECQ